MDERCIKIIDKVEVFGFNAAIRGMRNPKNSWDRSDSIVTIYPICDFEFGHNDLKLALQLARAGSEHRKFLRMIHVQFDINVPRYIWSEFDTYHHNTKNSCSTMHKLFNKESPITRDLFYVNDADIDLLDMTINKLNQLRECYLYTDIENRNVYLERAKQILPEGFLQLRTVDSNYEELIRMYFQRKNHRLKIWRNFCLELEQLPYFKEFIEVIR